MPQWIKSTDRLPELKEDVGYANQYNLKIDYGSGEPLRYSGRLLGGDGRKIRWNLGDSERVVEVYWLDESAKPEIVAAPLEFEVWDDRKGFPIYRSEDAFCNTYKVTSHYDGTFTYCAINKKQIDCASVDEGRVKCQEAANALIQKIAFLKY